MSQSSVLELLKKHPEGLISRDIINKYGFSRTVFTSLAKLLKQGEIKREVIRQGNYWKNLYKIKNVTTKQ
jgi:predicted DNA-binding transcriptional regulator